MTESIPAFFKQKRTELGLSVDEIARRTHLSAVRVWGFERELISLGLRDIHALFRALGVDPIEADALFVSLAVRAVSKPLSDRSACG